MFDVLDTDSNNAHLATAELDGEAMSCVLIFGQPVAAPLSENPLNVVLVPRKAGGPNYFWLEEALTCCKYFCSDKVQGRRSFFKNSFVLLILTQRLPAIGDKKFRPPPIWLKWLRSSNLRNWTSIGWLK